MSKIDFGAFSYPTGTLCCDRSICKNGYYRELAYVWENGQIDWRVSANELDADTRNRIYQIADRNAGKVEELREQYNTTVKQYGYLQNTPNEGLSLKEFNIKTWLRKVAVQLADLDQFRTAQVIHY